MKIRRKKDLYLEGEKVKIVLLKNAAAFDTEKTEAGIILSLDPALQDKEKKLADAKKSLIARPGEYEIKDVLIYALSSQSNDKIDLFSLDIDGINVVYLASGLTDLPSETIDQIGVCHILIVDVDDNEIKAKGNLVEEFDPYIVIPVSSDKEALNKFASAIGLPVPEAQNYLSYSLGQFDTEEEAATELALLA